MDVESFLNSLPTVPADSPYTHSVFTPSENGSLVVRNVDISEHRLEFWDYMFRDFGNLERNYSVSEVVRETMPLVFQVRTRYYNKNGPIDLDDFIMEDHYDFNAPTFLSGFYNSCLEIIRCFIELHKDHDLQKLCVYMEGLPIEDGETIIINQKFHFPYIRCSKKDYPFLRKKLIEELNEKNIASYRKDSTFSSIVDMIVDLSLSNENFLYQMTDKEGDSMTVKHFYLNDVMYELDSEHYDEFFPMNLINHYDIVVGPLTNKDIPGGVECLPFYLSYGFNPKVNKVIRPLNNNIVAKKAEVEKDCYYDDYLTQISNEIEERSILFLGMLNPDRYLKEIFWTEICDAIYTTFDEKKDEQTKGLNLFMESTEQALKRLNRGYEPYMLTLGDFETTCQSVYLRSRNKNVRITWKTLAWYAKEDSPVAFKKWHKSWYTEAMFKALDLSDKSLAEVVYRIFFLDYVCTFAKGEDHWMMYSKADHRFFRKGEIYLKDSFEIIERMYEDFKVSLTKAIRDCEDPAEKKQLLSKEPFLDKLFDNLKNDKKQNAAIKLAETKFKDINFIDRVDGNFKLMGVRNGVLHIGNRGHLTFRKGKPEDCITMSCGVKLNLGINLTHALVKPVLVFLGRMFKSKLDTCPEDSYNPDRNLYLRYVLKYLASMIHRKNVYKLFLVIIGSGDDGKSQFGILLDLMFGDYLVKSDIGILCNKKKGSGPSPEEYRLKNRAITILDEIGGSDFVNKEIMKRKMGNDKGYSRTLHDKGEDIEASTKFIGLGNEMFRFSNGADEATIERLLVGPANAKYKPVHKVSQDPYQQWKEGRYVADEHIEDQLPIMTTGLMVCLNWFYPKIEQEGGLRKNIPIDIADETKNYWTNNDAYNMFFKNKLIRLNVEDGIPAQKLTLVTAYDEFKIWFKKSFPQVNTPDRIKFRSAMERQFGPINGNGWYNLSINLNEDEDVEEESLITVQQQQEIIDSVNNSMRTETLRKENQFRPGGESTSRVPRYGNV